jgi:hypothetical protein
MLASLGPLAQAAVAGEKEQTVVGELWGLDSFVLERWIGQNDEQTVGG